MTEPTDIQGVPMILSDWMKEQPVSCCQTFKACCRPAKVRRRYARMALFKRFTVEELERRYQKQQPRLSHKEDQAVRQTIEKFKNGWYTGIAISHTIGTFYSPLSLLFTFLFLLPVQLCIQPFYLLPCTVYIFRSFSRKDNHDICCAYVLAAFYPLLVFVDIFWLLLIMVSIPLTVLILLPMEIVIFVVGLCWYRCNRLENSGVFVYNCALLLIIAQGKATRNYVIGTNNYTHTVALTKHDKGAELMLTHASPCWIMFNNPVVNIFKNLTWLEYSYGDVADHLFLSAGEVQMYEQLIQQNAALQREAQRLV